MENTEMIIVASLSFLLLLILFYNYSESFTNFKLAQQSPMLQTQPWTDDQKNDIKQLWFLYLVQTGVGCTDLNDQQHPEVINCMCQQIAELLSKYYTYEVMKNSVISQGFNPNIDIFGYFSPNIKMQIKNIMQNCANKSKCQLLLPGIFYVDQLFA